MSTRPPLLTLREQNDLLAARWELIASAIPRDVMIPLHVAVGWLAPLVLMPPVDPAGLAALRPVMAELEARIADGTLGTAKGRRRRRQTDAGQVATVRTEATRVHLSCISRGPKRTFGRCDPDDAMDQIAVPPAEKWTLETIHELIHDVAGFLPGGDPDGIAVAYVYLERDCVHLAVQTPGRAAEILLHASGPSESLRAALATLGAAALPDGDGIPLAIIPDPAADAAGGVR